MLNLTSDRHAILEGLFSFKRWQNGRNTQSD
jgi:hypothetical protein